MPATLRITKHAPSGTIILQRKEKRNALAREGVAELAGALDDFRQERAVRAVILTGAGDAFCAGTDLAELQSQSKEDDALARWQEDAFAFRDLLLQMLRFPKPLVAAVNGPALGLGCGLVLACDLVFASPAARFGFPEPLRGLSAGVSAPLAAFRLGGAHAARLLLGAETIDGEEARRIGLCQELAANDLLWARAHQAAERCARSAPESLLLTKRLLNETIGESLSTWLASGAAAAATARTTEAAAEGLAAFLEKRPPKWP